MQPVKPLTRIVALALVPFWDVTPLTARVVASLTALDVGWIYFGTEPALFALRASMIVTMSRGHNA